MSTLAPRDEASLREEIGQRLDTASLPLAGRTNISRRRGSNQVCDCCDRFVGTADELLEVAIERAGGPRSLSMHRRCFDLWIEESSARDNPLT